MSPDEAPSSGPPLALVGLWIVAAAASTMAGIGGGLFCVPILHFLRRIPLKTATRTSLLCVFVLATVSTLTELTRPDSGLDAMVIGCLLAGAFVGAKLGDRVHESIDARTLSKIFALVLVAAGLRVLMIESAAVAVEGPIQLAPIDYAIVVVVGFGGGFLAPLLGIGGGLLVVPGLFLSLDHITYLQARACSLAMAAVVSGQVSFAYWRSGRVHVPSALWFAPAAGVGAIIGTLLVHQPGWSEGARTFLGVTLLVVSLRFTLSLIRRRQDRTASG